MLVTGLRIGSYWIPAGTTCGISPAAMNRNQEIFGSDADEWKPERWLPTNDIGVFAAKAIAEPTLPTFHNRAISLAGDELTFDEACHIFRETYGHHAPMVPGFVGSIIQWSDKEIKSDFDWFRNVGLGADSQECKKVYPEMQDFRTWLVRTSAFGPATWKA